jgi:hypothetical protein
LKDPGCQAGIFYWPERQKNIILAFSTTHGRAKEKGPRVRNSGGYCSISHLCLFENRIFLIVTLSHAEQDRFYKDAAGFFPKDFLN